MSIQTSFTGVPVGAIEAGGYVRVAPDVVEHYPTLARITRGVPGQAYVPDVPILPALPVPLPRRWHRERVRHAQHEADLILYDADERQLLAARSVAAWGDVLAAYSLGDGALDVICHNDAASRAPDYSVLRRKWPFGAVHVRH